MKKRFLKVRNPLFIVAILLLILGGIAGYNLLLKPAIFGDKGPEPFLTELGRRHIEERHVKLDDFPFKSKFRSDVDYEALLDETYEKASSFRRERERYIYDYDTGREVGRKGQTSCRLVTEADGEVVTFYPRFKAHA